MRKEFNYDNWDTHRDMVLRSYALDGNLLTWNEMGVFGKTSLGNESVYNQGFALTRYISQKYGEDKLEKISKAMGKLTNFTIDAAFSDVLGKDGNEIYSEWKDYITKDYKKRSEKVLSNLVEGDKIASEGFGNFYPVYSPDGTKFIYISNKYSDYFGLSGIYLYDLKTKKEKLLVSNVSSTVSWIPGTNKIIYSKLTENNPNWYNVHDLYCYDINNDEEKRLTYDQRANQPSVSHDGTRIVYLFEKDGTTNLGTVDINGKNFKRLTTFENGEQVYDPKFSNDDKYIVFDYSYREGRDIAKIDTNGTGYKKIVSLPSDDRNPVFDKNGNMVYCSDKTGIFNIYSMNLNTGETKQLTNVIGGAFMPDVSNTGNIIYSGYTSKGFKIFQITPEEQNKVKPGEDYVWIGNPPLNSDKPKGDLVKFNLNRLRNYDDYKTPDYKEEKYTGVFSKLTFYPFLRLDNYNTANGFFQRIKPGLFVSSSDMLDRYSIFAGAAINSRLERDLFLTFDYRNKLPLLFDLGLKPQLSLELYNITRKTNTSVLFGADTVNNVVHYDLQIPTDVSYNLFEIDLAAKHRIFTRGSDLELRYIFSRYTATIGDFIYPSPMGPQLNPTFNDTYLIASNFQIKYSFQALLPYKDDDINPIGTEFSLQYNYEMNRYNNEGKYSSDAGFLKPDYNHFNFHRVEFNSKFHIPLWSEHTLTAQLRAGSILGPDVPDFFDFYLGGLIGMKAYPFYAVSGNEIGWLNLTYRFPLFKNIDARAGHLYLDKIFFSVYGDLGDAWNGKVPGIKSFKKGAGAEVRFQLNSFYIFPTSVFFNAAYGFDKFDRDFDNKIVTYGKEWRFYGGVLFGFDI
jgi:Tol biopolymer transport system component